MKKELWLVTLEADVDEGYVYAVEGDHIVTHPYYWFHLEKKTEEELVKEIQKECRRIKEEIERINGREGEDREGIIAKISEIVSNFQVVELVEDYKARLEELKKEEKIESWSWGGAVKESGDNLLIYVRKWGLKFWNLDRLGIAKERMNLYTLAERIEEVGEEVRKILKEAKEIIEEGAEKKTWKEFLESFEFDLWIYDPCLDPCPKEESPIKEFEPDDIIERIRNYEAWINYENQVIHLELPDEDLLDVVERKRVKITDKIGKVYAVIVKEDIWKILDNKLFATYKEAERYWKEKCKNVEGVV